MNAVSAGDVPFDLGFLAEGLKKGFRYVQKSPGPARAAVVNARGRVLFQAEKA